METRYIEEMILTNSSELAQKVREFLEWLKVKNYSPKTGDVYRRSLNYFLFYCREVEVKSLAHLSPQVIEGYEKLLLKTIDKHGKLLSTINRFAYLRGVVRFCSWLTRKDWVLSNPAANVVLPKIPKNIQANILTHRQIEEIINQADVTNPFGLRDRAIMELLYSTGIRRAELVGLTVWDVDLQNRIVYIRKGKGGKQRIVPMGERAAQWISKYLKEVRVKLAREEPTQALNHQSALFLTYAGRGIRGGSVGVLIKTYVRKCGHRGGCHLFRHVMATEMLGHGADLRHIQEMLGHERIDTTEVYTHVDISKLKAVYEQTQPAGKYEDATIHVEVAKPVRRGGRANKTEKQKMAEWERTELGRYVRKHLEKAKLAGYSDTTIEKRKIDLKLFVIWCGQRAIEEVKLLTPSLLERYAKHLATKVSKGKSFSPGYIVNSLVSLSLFCRFLANQGILAYDLSKNLDRPKYNRPIPCQLLSAQEIYTLLNQPDISSPIGVRDRALLETLAATGIRRRELVDLWIDDFNFEKESVHIRHGKGGKSRIIPISQKALAWVHKYLEEVRPLLVKNPEEKAVFLGTGGGNGICCRHVNYIVKKYLKAAGINKPGSCHILRHALATAMLDNGADIRYIQSMLGHTDLQATQVYTKVTIRKLKEVHAKTHPAKLPPPDAHQNS